MDMDSVIFMGRAGSRGHLVHLVVHAFLAPSSDDGQALNGNGTSSVAKLTKSEIWLR
jgi:hypothetical protein